MSFIEKAKIMDYLLSLIRRHSTGCPDQLAARLQVDRRTALRYIAQLKEEGIPIEYSHTLGSYVFAGEVKYEFKIMVNEEELLGIKGGLAFSQNFLQGDKFCLRACGVL